MSDPVSPCLNFDLFRYPMSKYVRIPITYLRVGINASLSVYNNQILRRVLTFVHFAFLFNLFPVYPQKVGRQLVVVMWLVLRTCVRTLARSITSAVRPIAQRLRFDCLTAWFSRLELEANTTHTRPN